MGLLANALDERVLQADATIFQPALGASFCEEGDLDADQLSVVVEEHDLPQRTVAGRDGDAASVDVGSVKRGTGHWVLHGRGAHCALFNDFSKNSYIIHY